MRKVLPLYLRNLILVCFVLFSALASKANHIVGMDLSYAWVSGNTYRITLVAYGDCGVATPDLSVASPLICIYNGTTSVGNINLTIVPPTSGTEITPVCPASIGSTTCSGGTIPGVKRYVYSGTYTLPTTSRNWRFIFNGNMSGSSAGRASTVTNTTGVTVMQLIDSLDNRFVNNSSPILTVPPTPYFCLNNPNTYNPGGVDPDGDSLVFTLVRGRVASSNCNNIGTGSGLVTYTSAFQAWPGTPISETTPLRVTAGDFSFNSTNGQVDFNPNFNQIALVVYNVKEYRGDTLVGTSQREMTFLVQPCTVTPPTGVISSPVNGAITGPTSFQVCAGTGPFSFHILPTSPDPLLNIKVTAVGIPSGATFNVINDSTPNPDATFSWTSTSVAPGLYTIFVTYKDDQCPISGSNTVAYSITINSLADIAGTGVLCAGATTTLTNTTSGGSWSSSSPSVATVGSGTGVVTGVSGGTATISYSVGTCFKTTVVTVNPQPTVFTGSLALCVGLTTTLNSTPAGGTWSSSNVVVATVGGATGVVTGNLAGTSNITYTLPITGCFRTATVTVNGLPGAISGTQSVCVGATTTLVSTPTGGTWSEASANVSVNATTGVVTGLVAGTAIVTYSLGTGCITTAVVTVNPLPNIINPIPPTILCVGNTATFTNATSGGTWSSSNAAVATVSAGGLVTAVAPGTANITYTISATGCFIIKGVTVNTSPAAITPASVAVCTGSSITLSNTVTGGTWSSSNTARATVVSTTGVVTGVVGATAGTVNITYAIGTCTAIREVTVNVTPGAITGGVASLCIGDNTTWINAAPGGTWSSSNAAVATVTAGGLVSGVALGTATISYIITATGCFATRVVTVNTTPAAITPASVAVCTGSSVTLSNTVTGGTWSSSNTARATVVSTTGVVTGVVGATAGTVNITYSVGSCTAIRVVTVNVTPGPITGGSASICIGDNTTWTNATPGGTWSSSNIAVASVSAGGVVNGVATGVATITYTISATGCFVTRAITVNTTPAGITPTSGNVCVGTSTPFTNTTPGGTWTSSNTSIAIIGTASGVATGVSFGTANISYSIGSCFAVATVVVNTTPVAITPAGPVSVCVGDATTLTNTTPGGVWSSSTPAVATIGTSGVVTGVALGTTTISYTVGSCSVTKVVSVGVTPSAILPSSPTVCLGGVATLTNTIPGGTWSSSNLAVATVGSSTGVVSGFALGTAVISYSIGSCFATTTLTVISLPAAGTISGPAVICVTTTGAYSNATPGGVWSTANGNASITSGGVATGVSPGLDTILYSVTNACGTSVATFAVTVNPLSSAGSITGPTSVCVSGLITLSASVPGGVWSSSNTNATVGSISGVVTGVLPGLDTITYTVSSVCGVASTSHIVTINALPTAGSITGPLSVCEGSTIPLSGTITGGTWSAANGTATINTSSGLVTGVTAGTNIITYTVSNACGTATTTRGLTVNPLPNAGTISGADSVCIASSISLTASVPGGVWSAGNANATVSSVGLVTGVNAGTVPVSYTVTNVCGVTSAVKIITIVAPPVSGTISGPFAVCLGSGITLTSSSPGGVWTSSNANAIVSGPGIITGAVVGTSVISYSVTNLCGTASSTRDITVNPIPSVAPITGPTSHCVGSSITLNNTTPGGNWTSSNMAVATVGLTTGIVNGVSAGVVNITYTVTNGFGCPASAIALDSVLVVPIVPAIDGNANVCLGATTTLTNTVTGGTWSSSNTAVISIDAAGVATGLSLGTATITYTVNNICGTTVVTRVQTVAPLPAVAPITGTATQCVGTSTILSSATAGGVWTSADISIATAVTTTGVVTGVSAGITNITYTFTDVIGCANFATIANTVQALPVVAPITGTASVCIGSTTTLANATPAGIWSSSDVTVATVDTSTGIVAGITSGTSVISYSVVNAFGCIGIATIEVSVNPLPVVDPITGITSVCVGATTTLSSSTTGGTWSSSDVATATADAAGDVTGVNAGTVTISYGFTDGLGCTGYATTVVTVNALPVVPSITGTATVCVGASTTLSNSLSGGAWSSADISVATVATATGFVGGVSGGVTDITYTYTDVLGCSGIATIPVTVNALPIVAPITGVTNVCVGGTALLANATAGGVWSSSNIAVATIDAVGTVSGLAGGIVTISYAVTDGFGCTGIATTPDTVNVVPVSTPITGVLNVCLGGTTALSSSSSFGVWSSSDISVATVSAAGVVSGLSAGTAIITYFVSNPCGSATDVVVVTVNPLPSAGTITALFSTVCAGGITNLSSTVPGGVWSSSDLSVATVDASTGAVTSIVPGTAIITYTVTSAGCTGFSTYTLTVGPAIPGLAVLPIGSSSLCNGNPVNLAVSSVTPGLSYQWLIDGNIIAGATNAGYVTDTVGLYSVIVDNGVCSQILAGPNVVFMPQPVIAFNAPNLLFTGSYATYQWYRNGVAIIGANSSVITLLGVGAYTVIVEDANGCRDTSAVYYVTGGGGGSSNVATTSIVEVKIFPNPATSMLSIDAPVKVTAVVMTMDGRKVIEQINATTLDISKLSTGMYLIQVFDEQNMLLKTAKFTKSE